jgi:pyruvate/2-oxoglutarate dehydrogenase complex dihydrolipoamide dehydrogenase (E3) component
MERHGTRFIRSSVPKKFEKLADGRVKVTYTNSDFGNDVEEEFDTVILAVGRDACTPDLGLEAVGLALEKSGKLAATHEQTHVDNIFAVGDVLESRQELTPVAIQAGRLLAQRLYNHGSRTMDYEGVPTTVFTPLEYSCCGLSEEDAEKRYGADDLEVYVSYLKPLEWCCNKEEHNGTMHREDNVCYVKMICVLSEKEKVVGLHYLGPNAGEVMQGYAVAMKVGATKEDFDNTVGIHPTVAEEFTTLTITKRSGHDAQKKGC